jgi:Flp pilus assembly pilin Flp
MVRVERLRMGAEAMVRTVAALIGDDSGQDLLEYALLAGLVGAVGAVILPEIAAQMAVAYDGWLVGAEAVWDPPAPGS